MTDVVISILLLLLDSLPDEHQPGTPPPCPWPGGSGPGGSC